MTFAREDPFTPGEIAGMRRAGATRDAIVKTVRKKNGSEPSLRAVDGVLAKIKSNPRWTGTDSVAGGRPLEISELEKKRLKALVFAERGKAVVTVLCCKQRLPWLQKQWL